MKIVFMGTPDFAAAALEAIIKAGHEVSCVVTQPDKPKGRGKEMQYPPVKECALRYELPVLQPVKIKTAEAIEALRQYEADIYIVAAFGQILSQEILDIPQYGCVNIHASLLPKYRGAAPIQWAILEGETETGITVMQMNAGLDTGDMLTKKTVQITAADTGESLHDKLSRAGAELIVETLPLIEQGKITPQTQDDTQSSYARMLNKSMGCIDWNKSAVEIERQIRALNSWPSAYTTYRDKTMKIWEARVETIKDAGEQGVSEDKAAEAGRIAAVEKDCVKVMTGDGLLCITSVQLAGKKRMAVKEFLLGYQMTPGEMLGI